MLSAAQLLDELMGRDRNLAPDEKRCNVRWDHETVSERICSETCSHTELCGPPSDLKNECRCVCRDDRGVVYLSVRGVAVS